MKKFKSAGGSVPGTDHINSGQPSWRNNQDAFAIEVTDTHIVAVVSDGCGANPRSEVGATLGSRIVCQALHEFFDSGGQVTAQTASELLSHVEMQLVRNMRLTAEMLGDQTSFESRVKECLLFTLVGAVVTDSVAFVFTYGDGVFAINGDISVIEEFEGDAPPYPAYRLVSTDMPDSALGFQLRAYMSADEVQSILIGTDGVEKFIAAEHTVLSGKGGEVGPLAQFWENQKFVNNPDNIRRRLAVINNDHVVEGRIKSGHLRDDTTIVVVQRIPEEEN